MTKRIHKKSLASLALSSALVLSPLAPSVFAEDAPADNDDQAVEAQASEETQEEVQGGEVSFDEVSGETGNGVDSESQTLEGADELNEAQVNGDDDGKEDDEEAKKKAEEEAAQKRAEELAAQNKLEVNHNFVTLEAAQAFGKEAQEEYDFIKGFEASYDKDTEGVETATVILIAADDADVAKIKIDEDSLELSYEGGYGEDIQDEEPKDEEPKDEEPKDEEPKDEEPKDEEPKDEVPKDEEPKDKEPKDEEPKDEEPKDEKPKGEKPLDDNKDKDENKKPLPDAPTVDNKVPSFNTLEDAQTYAKAQLDKHSFLTAYEITQAKDGQYEVHFKANLSEGQVLDFDDQGNPLIVGGEEKKEDVGVRYTLTQQFASQAQAEDYGAKFKAANPDYVLDYEAHKSGDGYSVTFTVVEGYAIAESDQGAKVVMLPKHADGQYAYASLEAAQLRANELKQEFATQVKDIEVVQNDDGTYSLAVTFADGYDGNFIIQNGVETLEITRTPADAVGPHTQGPTGFVPTGTVNQPAGNTPLPNAIANPNARMAGNMGKRLPGQALPTAGEAVGVLGGIGAVVSAAGAGIAAYLKRRR